mgnify:CR=1 FL=1
MRPVMRPVWHALALTCATGLIAGCPQNKSGDDTSKLLEDASFGRRVFRPPPSDPVRAVPPHNIHRHGVGPYELSASLQTTLALLPNGPRVELFEAEGLFDYRLMRSDKDALLLGVGRRGGVAFISVLDPDIARTENGIGVGAGVTELIGALGALKAPLNQGRDSRIITFTALPDTRFIVEKGRVVAAVVMPADSADAKVTSPTPTPSTPVPEPACDTAAIEKRRSEFLVFAKSEALATESSVAVAVQFDCLTSGLAGALMRHGDEVGWAIIDPASGEIRLSAKTTVPDLSFATILDTGADQPEIYAVSERRSLQLREVVVTRLSLIGSKLVGSWDRVAFSMEAKTASWIGAQMQTADFLVEMYGRPGAVEVGGIYMERNHGALNHVVPVDRIELPVVREAPRKLPVESPAKDAGAPVAPVPKKSDARPSAKIPQPG